MPRMQSDVASPHSLLPKARKRTFRPALAFSSDSKAHMAAALTSGRVLRLAHKAGVKYVSSDVRKELVEHLHDFASTFVKGCVGVATEDRRKTITPEMVKMALNNIVDQQKFGCRVGRAYWGDDFGDGAKRCPTRKLGDRQGKGQHWKHGTVALQNIRYEQKLADCLYMRLSPFERCVKALSTGFRWMEAAIRRIQTVLESYIVERLQEANLAAIHAKRKTVMAKDIQLIEEYTVTP